MKEKISKVLKADLGNLNIFQLVLVITFVFVVVSLMGIESDVKVNKTYNEDNPVDNVNDAFRICKMLEETGYTSGECEVSGWEETITVKFDITSSEARRLCLKIKDISAKKGINPASHWRLRIGSPFTGQNVLAICDL